MKLVFWLYLTNTIFQNQQGLISSSSWTGSFRNQASIKLQFWKNFMEEMNKISPSMISVFVAIINDGKCRNERCKKFNKKLNDHEIEICYFIPLKAHLQRILCLFMTIVSIHHPGTTLRNIWANTVECTDSRKRTGKPLYGNKTFSPLLCVLGVPTKVLLDYMHIMLASEFLRRLNIWLDH